LKLTANETVKNLGDVPAHEIMSHIEWQSWQILSNLIQSLEELFVQFSALQETTIWVGSSGSDWISEIVFAETDATITLQIHLPLQLEDISIKVSSETAVIRGRRTDDVEGYFCSGYVQNFIPLPIAVHPETVQAELNANLLTLILQKSGRIRQQRLTVPLKKTVSSSPQGVGAINRVG
jgi:HSP20 family molecular chaperone IbpA